MISVLEKTMQGRREAVWQKWEGSILNRVVRGEGKGGQGRLTCHWAGRS